jgi:hypothetical protein
MLPKSGRVKSDRAMAHLPFCKLGFLQAWFASLVSARLFLKTNWTALLPQRSCIIVIFTMHCVFETTMTARRRQPIPNALHCPRDDASQMLR